MWKLKADERLSRWRDFRNRISDLALEEALSETVQFWSSVPFDPYYLDPDKPDEWPSPWELIKENYYCDLAKVLGIVYTIHLTSHGPSLDAEICVYYDPDTRYTYNLAVFNQGKYVINLAEGEVVNNTLIDKKWKLRYRFTSDDIKLKEY